MDIDLSRRPAGDEHAPVYERYVSRVPDGDIVATLVRQARDTQALLGGLAPDRAGHRYAPGKWSVRDVLGHITDCERVFAYRALSFARGATDELPGFEEDEFAQAAGCDHYALSDLLDDFAAVRAATVGLFRRFDAQAWERRGVANGATVSVRALAWILAGHERHHVGVLRDRYL